MTASNHVITGSLFVTATASVVTPWVALPLAFLLHFVLDSIPHFGQPTNPVEGLKRLRWLLPIDASIGGLLLVLLLAIRPELWVLAIAGGILCASPDLFSIPRFVRFLKTGESIPGNDRFSRFHSSIQHEYLWGAWVELLWFGVVLVLFTKYLVS